MPGDISYRFGRFELDRNTRQLLVDGRSAEMGVRAFDLLLALIERQGRLVTKDELLDLVWPGVVVEENNLQVQVSTLRKILGAHAITTVPGRGYQFTLRADNESPSSSGKRHHNLPRPLTSFIGREAELAEYAHALQEARLLTLTGIGGSGKTRLAIKLGENTLSAYPDGVWFIDLASIVDPNHLPFALASTLAIREVSGKTIEEALCDHVADRRMLLIHDNCEHLLDACADLARRLLEAAPGLRILATSRESLGLSGERILPVRSLQAPPSGNDDDLTALAACESVHLLVERAKLALPSFALTAANARGVADVCRRLDGIPLAIELAAALVKLLSIEQIRAGLGDRFRLLVGGARALPRHQTLRAVLQWSYEHLDAEAQRLLRLFSVFAGGWTLQAATALAEGKSPDASSVVAALGRLLDKSLLMVEHQPVDEPRYRMLETVRQYAAERLDELGEGDRARTQHLTYYLQLAADADELVLSGKDMAPFVARLDHELDNILAAHAWCDHAKNGASLGLQLVNFVRGYWVERRFRVGLPAPETDPIAIGYRVMLEALARPGAEARTMYRCRALFGLSQLSFLMRRFQEAEAHLIESSALARELADDKILAARLGVLAVFDQLRNDLGAAQSRVEEALEAAQRSENPHYIAVALLRLGEVSNAQGKLPEAVSCLTRGLALARSSGPALTVASTQIELSWVFVRLGNHAGAVESLCEATPLVRACKDMQRGIILMSALCNLATACKAQEGAARFCGATLAHLDTMSLPVEAMRLAQVIDELKHQMDERVYAVNEAAGRQLSYQHAFDEASAWLNSVNVAAVTMPRNVSEEKR